MAELRAKCGKREGSYNFNIGILEGYNPVHNRSGQRSRNKVGNGAGTGYTKMEQETDRTWAESPRHWHIEFFVCFLTGLLKLTCEERGTQGRSSF